MTPFRSPSVRAAFATLLLLTASGLVACDASRLAEPLALTPAADGPRKTIQDDAHGVLGVGIIGYDRLNPDTMTTYYANVSGGVGPYYYDWFQSNCDESECSALTPIDGGWGKNSIQTFLGPTDIRIHLSVHVYDSQSVPSAGALDKIIINYNPPRTTTYATFYCDLGEHFYPVHRDDKWYRINPCSGADEYSPTNTMNNYPY